MKKEEYFWKMWNMRGKGTLILFNRMLESKKFEHMSLMSWKYNKSGFHKIDLYKRYKEYVLKNACNDENYDDKDRKDDTIDEDVKKFVKKIKDNDPELIEWLDTLEDD